MKVEINFQDWDYGEPNIEIELDLDIIPRIGDFIYHSDFLNDKQGDILYNEYGNELHDYGKVVDITLRKNLNTGEVYYQIIADIKYRS